MELSDIARDSRLDIEVFADHAIHTYYSSNPAAGRIQVRDKWERKGKLGSGGFATVYLESCVSGPNSGELRAVKVINKRLTTNWDRELETIAKFSHERYRHCFVRSSGWYEDVSAVFIAMEYFELGDLEK